MNQRDEEHIEEEEEEEEVDPVEECLWLARTGELEALSALLRSGQVQYDDCRDPQTGSTPLHMAAANGHSQVVEFLLGDQVKADQTVVNKLGSTALHWAVQNGRLDVVRLLCAQPQADVLLKNANGKGCTTLAIEKNHTDIVKILLEHPSAEPLEPKGRDGANKEEEGEDDAGKTEDGANREEDVQIHDSTYHFIKSNDDPNPAFSIREIGYRPRTLEELAEGDATRTHYTVWAASVILARWVVRDAIPAGKSVLELGAGCGLPGLAVYRCCKPAKVLLTDLEVRDHLLHNMRTAKKKVVKSAKGKSAVPPMIGAAAIDWMNQSSLPQEWIGQTDVLLGSDLVYDKDLVSPLVKTSARLSTPKTGVFYYVTAVTDRAGMDEFLQQMREHYVLESKVKAPKELLKNPLGEEKQDLFELHLSEMRDVDHMMYKFRKN